MQQINFRIEEDEKMVLDLLAKHHGQSVAEYTRKTIEKEIAVVRIDLAFQLLHEGKIGFKRCWKISGLMYHEFINEWTKRNGAEVIPEEIEEKGVKLAISLDPKLFLRNAIPPSE